MILNALLLLLAVVCVVQPNAGRALAACIFSGLTLVFASISENFVGAEYYIGAAMTDLAIIVLLSGIYPVPRLVGRLQGACIASIMLNFLGWSAWFFYIPPAAYDWAFIGLYAYAVYALLKRDKTDVVGGGTVHSWFTLIRSNPSARSGRASKNPGEI